MKKFYYSNGNFYAIIAAPNSEIGLVFLNKLVKNTEDTEPYSLYREQDFEENETIPDKCELLNAGGEG